MKQVIFVCLLALSVCFSQAAPPVETAGQTTPLLQQNGSATETKPSAVKPEQTPATGAAPADASKPPAVTAGTTETQNVTSTNTTQTKTVSNETTTKPNETKPSSEKSNPTETKTGDNTPKPVEPSKVSNETKPVVPVNPPAANGTNADGKDGKKTDTTSTTPKGEIVSPTVAPVEAKSRAFDGPSFIGGIILTLGLLAIGFMGFKYYKNQTERNYHTL